jgi:serine/threonine kinase 32
MGNVCCCADNVDYDGEVNLFHFELHRAVGKGAFGKVRFLFLFRYRRLISAAKKVRVIEHRRSKKLYALKYIEKAKCIKQSAVANVIQERRLLEEVSPNS